MSEIEKRVENIEDCLGTLLDAFKGVTAEIGQQSSMNEAIQMFLIELSTGLKIDEDKARDFICYHFTNSFMREAEKLEQLDGEFGANVANSPFFNLELLELDGPPKFFE